MAVAAPRPRAPGARALTIVAVLLAVALVAWLVTIDRMRGMDEGPGTDLGAAGWFLGAWVTMMAAMMLPSAGPVTVLYARSLDRQRTRRSTALATTLFVVGYLAAWTAFGIVAYVVFRVIDRLSVGALAWDRAGPYVAGAAIVIAGVYQLTPLKTMCLRHCRSPIHFLLHSWHGGLRGALRMGAEHGVVCVGCCWGLMLALFAVGVMSLFWMALVAAIVFAEKVLPWGDRLSKPLAVALIALGIWVAVAPETVPGLTDPAGAEMTQM